MQKTSQDSAKGRHRKGQDSDSSADKNPKVYDSRLYLNFDVKSTQVYNELSCSNLQPISTLLSIVSDRSIVFDKSQATYATYKNPTKILQTTIESRGAMGSPSKTKLKEVVHEA